MTEISDQNRSGGGDEREKWICDSGGCNRTIDDQGGVSSTPCPHEHAQAMGCYGTDKGISHWRRRAT